MTLTKASVILLLLSYNVSCQEFYQNDSLTSMVISDLTYPLDLKGVNCVLDDYLTNKIWCIGGSGLGAATDLVYSFNGTSFTSETPLGTNMYSHDGGATIIEGVIYMASGTANYTMSYNISNGAFDAQYSKLPNNLTLNFVKLAYNGDNLIYFGLDENNLLNYTIWYLDINTKIWNKLKAKLLFEHPFGALVYYENKILAIGGEGQEVPIEYYNINSNSKNFTESTNAIGGLNFPIDLYRFGYVVLDNGIFYSIGGIDTPLDIYVYDINNDIAYKSNVSLDNIIDETSCTLDTTYKLWCFAGAFSGKNFELDIIFESNSPLLFEAPSQSPSSNPSISPTKYPSLGPTVIPTVNPSFTPSTFPSKYPTLTPSKFPSKYPIFVPTTTPTKYPSVPSNVPSDFPTNSPNSESSVNPFSLVLLTSLSDNGNFNPNMRFSLTLKSVFSSEEYESQNVSFFVKWSCDGCSDEYSTLSDKYDEISLYSETISNETGAYFNALITLNYLSWNGENIYSIQICNNGTIFEDGQNYTISATISVFYNDKLIQQNETGVVLHANTKPNIPTDLCYISPLVGKALETEFSLFCNYSDIIQTNYPNLTYNFYYQQSFLSTFEPLNFDSDIYTQVFGTGVHTVKAVLLDSNNYATCFNLDPINVTLNYSQNPNEILDAIIFFVDSLVTEEDTNVLVNDITSASNTITDYGNSDAIEDETIEDLIEVQKSLVSILTDAVVNLDLSTDELVTVTQTYSVITESVCDCVNKESFYDNNMTLYMINALSLTVDTLSVALTEENEVLDTYTGESVLQSVDNIVNISHSATSETVETAEEKQAFGSTVVDIYKSVGQLLLIDAIVGESYAMKTDSVLLASSRFSKSNIFCPKFGVLTKLSQNYTDSISTESNELDCIVGRVKDNVYDINNDANIDWRGYFVNLEVRVPLQVSNRRRLGSNNTITDICDPLLIAMPNQNRTRKWNGTKRFPHCLFYDKTNRNFSGKGCYVHSKNERETTCACLHMSFFGVSADSFKIQTNPIDLSHMPKFTWNNFKKQPYGLVVSGSIIVLSIVLLFTLPTKDDHPLIADKGSINSKFILSQIEDIQYRVLEDRKILDNNELSVFQKLWKLWKLSMISDHEIISLCFRKKGTGYTGKQRVGLLSMKLMTVIAVSGAFYGNRQPSQIGDFIVAILGTLLAMIPKIMKQLFIRSEIEERNTIIEKIKSLAKSVKNVLSPRGGEKYESVSNMIELIDKEEEKKDSDDIQQTTVRNESENEEKKTVEIDFKTEEESTDDEEIPSVRVPTKQAPKESFFNKLIFWKKEETKLIPDKIEDYNISTLIYYLDTPEKLSFGDDYSLNDTKTKVAKYMRELRLQNRSNFHKLTKTVKRTAHINVSKSPDSLEPLEDKYTNFQLTKKERQEILNTLRRKLLNSQRKLPHWCHTLSWILIILWILVCTFIALYWSIRFDEIMKARNDSYESKCENRLDYSLINEFNYNSTEKEVKRIENSDSAVFEPPKNDSFGEDLTSTERWLISILMSYMYSLFITGPIIRFLLQIKAIVLFDPFKKNESYFFSLSHHFV